MAFKDWFKSYQVYGWTFKTKRAFEIYSNSTWKLKYSTPHDLYMISFGGNDYKTFNSLEELEEYILNESEVTQCQEF